VRSLAVLPHVIYSFDLGDVQSGRAVTTWDLGTGVENQQVGNTWCNIGDIVSLSLSGDLNVFDARVGGKPTRVVTVR
jgi:WD repeat-containing protein 1 (actin-interacting protein 1)